MKAYNCLLPVLSIAAAAAIAWLLPDSTAHPEAEHPYFLWVLLIFGALYLLLWCIPVKGLHNVLNERAKFYAGVALFLNLLNVLTVKLAVLPVLYFPSLDRVFGVLIEDGAFIGTCVLYSLRLQLTGWFCGALAGIGTGIAIGFNRHVKYWVYPLVRVLGPIPSTAWIPLVLITFPTVVSASAFLIALAVWFPTTVLTSSGIASIKQSYFEVASTLGAKPLYTIFRVGVPAAMPHMFIGLFNGTCSSFITLVTAEMLGAKYGLGWYVNWQKDMMSYANVYAGLIVLSLICYCIITMLFKLRDHVLVWQKGVIKW